MKAELRRVRDLGRVYELELRSVVMRSAYVGMTQRQIAQELDISQSTVHRLINDPFTPTSFPAQCILKRSAGTMSSAEMMTALLEWVPMATTGEYPTVNGHPTDAHVPGSWDVIELSYYTGQITDDEMQVLADAFAEELSRRGTTRGA